MILLCLCANTELRTSSDIFSMLKRNFKLKLLLSSAQRVIALPSGNPCPIAIWIHVWKVFCLKEQIMNNEQNLTNTRNQTGDWKTAFRQTELVFRPDGKSTLSVFTWCTVIWLLTWFFKIIHHCEFLFFCIARVAYAVKLSTLQLTVLCALYHVVSWLWSSPSTLNNNNSVMHTGIAWCTNKITMSSKSSGMMRL